MEKQVLLLRTSYWVAALADFIIAWLVLDPHRMGLTGVVYPMGLASVIAFSWAVLLLIADRKPIERRWILIPTILVVSLLTIVRIIFWRLGFVDSSPGILLFGVGLVLFMSYSYHYANKQAVKQ